jgi:hypothetical protein
MPNWCNNNVSISHPDRSKMEALLVAVKAGEFCNHVKPVPEELKIVAGRVGDDNDAAQIALEAAEKSNREKFGYATWYDYCVNEWGTKWDINTYEGNDIELDDNNTIYFGFDSAWAPPIGIYEALLDQGYTVLAQYYEPGMAFVGEWDDGYDNFFEYGGETSATVRDLIGEELDDLYGISESMAEFEDEREEDEELYTWVKEGAQEKAGDE